MNFRNPDNGVSFGSRYFCNDGSALGGEGLAAVLRKAATAEAGNRTRRMQRTVGTDV